MEDAAVQPVLSSIMPAIPSPSFDSYWEFSFYPSKDLNYTKMEVDSLYDAGLLRDVHEYPLHMTVAGIQNDRDAFTFVSALEMSGGTTKEQLARTLAKAAELATLYTSSDWHEFQIEIEQQQRSAGLQLAPWPKPRDDAVMWERYAGQLIETQW